jgi:hypothetical protein
MDLSRSVLPDADLSHARLNGANLSGVVLTGAKLTGANLTGALLESSILNGADLSSALLQNARLWHAQVDAETRTHGAQWWTADFYDIPSDAASIPPSDTGNPMVQVDRALISKLRASFEPFEPSERSDLHRSLRDYYSWAEGGHMPEV